MVKDVTASNMHDIMKRIEGSEDAITHRVYLRNTHKKNFITHNTQFLTHIPF
jgi:hypothetical protein